ncbi:hypothetical protein, partial [uncultured Alistipes sp.]|uniref:hypothetical protein n=2 Tax=uncultured Alistipes sp. TaxID=538949 RepID=UPI00262961BD
MRKIFRPLVLFPFYAARLFLTRSFSLVWVVFYPFYLAGNSIARLGLPAFGSWILLGRYFSSAYFSSNNFDVLIFRFIFAVPKQEFFLLRVCFAEIA